MFLINRLVILKNISYIGSNIDMLETFYEFTKVFEIESHDFH